MITRRELLFKTALISAGAALGCRAQDAEALRPTESNIEGPFFRKGSPLRTKLAEGLKGDPLAISGRVRGLEGRPLSDAVIEVWHADAEGEYDTSSDLFRMRGRMITDKNGVYRYETIMPGQYDLGESKRPAHIHYKIAAEGHRPLTTQLYFAGDPFLGKDPFVRKSLIIDLRKEKISVGVFDIILGKDRS